MHLVTLQKDRSVLNLTIPGIWYVLPGINYFLRLTLLDLHLSIHCGWQFREKSYKIPPDWSTKPIGK